LLSLLTQHVPNAQPPAQFHTFITQPNKPSELHSTTLLLHARYYCPWTHDEMATIPREVKSHGRVSGRGSSHTRTTHAGTHALSLP